MPYEVLGDRRRDQIRPRSLHHPRADKARVIRDAQRDRLSIQRPWPAREDLDRLRHRLKRIADSNPRWRRAARGDDLHDLVRMLRRPAERLYLPGRSGLHALFERQVAVALQQQIQPARQPSVVRAEARVMWIRHPAKAHGRRRIDLAFTIEHPLVLDEIAIPTAVEAPLAYGLNDLRDQPLSHKRDRLRAP